jgi:hypothetical protein
MISCGCSGFILGSAFTLQLTGNHGMRRADSVSVNEIIEEPRSRCQGNVAPKLPCWPVLSPKVTIVTQAHMTIVGLGEAIF